MPFIDVSEKLKLHRNFWAILYVLFARVGVVLMVNIADRA
jgi:hypothetical protein